MINVVFAHYSSLFNTIWYHATVPVIKSHMLWKQAGCYNYVHRRYCKIVLVYLYNSMWYVVDKLYIIIIKCF